jgi:4-hydroxy-3-methylbut-2-enyl diphosphate reductase
MLAGASELILVVGSKNSSNSVRLMEVGKRAGAKDARLIDDARGIDWSWFEGVNAVGLTAGASAPEDLVQGVIDAMAARYDVTVEELIEARETVTFKLPRLLTA